jgi:hypothetical protein
MYAQTYKHTHEHHTYAHYTYVRTYIHTCEQDRGWNDHRTRKALSTHTHTHTYIYIHTHMYIYIHTQTHTHTFCASRAVCIVRMRGRRYSHGLCVVWRRVYVKTHTDVSDWMHVWT